MVYASNPRHVPFGYDFRVLVYLNGQLLISQSIGKLLHLKILSKSCDFPPPDRLCVCVNTCVWRQEIDVCCLQSFSTSFFKTGSLIVFGALASKPQGSLVSIFLVPGLQGCITAFGFLRGYWRPELRYLVLCSKSSTDLSGLS